MDIAIRVHRYRWVCQECGEIEDRSLEIQVDGKGIGRWFDDGHQGFSRIDENAVEYLLMQHLEIDFLVLEHIRLLRSRRRVAEPGLGQSFDDVDRTVFDRKLATQGHRVSRSETVFKEPRN